MNRKALALVLILSSFGACASEQDASLESQWDWAESEETAQRDAWLDCVAGSEGTDSEVEECDVRHGNVNNAKGFWVEHEEPTAEGAE